MTISCTEDGEEIIDMKDHAKAMISEHNRDAQSIGAGTEHPWNEKLFTVDEASPLLPETKREIFTPLLPKGHS